MAEQRTAEPRTAEGAAHDHGACVDEAMARASALCAERGAQLTPIREKVLRIVWRSHKPIGAYEVLDELSRSHKSARPPTVYRALDFLMGEGLIHKIESLNAYLGCVEAGGPHTSEFLICRKCGTAEEILDPKLDQALEAAARRAHFCIERKVVEVAGLCERCAG